MKLITNASGKTIAYENDVSPYRQEIRSPNGALLGYFNPKEGPGGKTHDRSGRVVSNSGDIRASLIPRAK
jgi:hypothetical protein